MYQGFWKHKSRRKQIIVLSLVFTFFSVYINFKIILKTGNYATLKKNYLRKIYFKTTNLFFFSPFSQITKQDFLVVYEDGFRELLVSSGLSLCASGIWAPQWRDDGSYWMIVLGRIDAMKVPGDNHQMTSFRAAEVLLYFMECYLESTREQSAVFRCCCGSFPRCFE